MSRSGTAEDDVLRRNDIGNGGAIRKAGVKAVPASSGGIIAFWIEARGVINAGSG